MSNEKSKLTFAPRTKLVKLPSQGKLYSVDHPYHDKTEVKIYAMSGRHEDILSNEDYLRSNTMITELLKAAVVDKIDIDMLLTGDATSLVYAHRITGFGPKMEMNINCLNCNTIDRIKVNLNEFEIHNLGLKALVPYKNEFELKYQYKGLEKLYHNEYIFRFKLLRWGDAESIRTISAGRSSKGLKTSGRFSDVLRRLLISINGNESLKEEFVDNGPADFIHDIYTKILDVTPRFDDRVSHKCSRCGTEITVLVVADANFFWPERI